MYLHRLILLLASLMPLYASAAPATPKMVHIEAERLPDMNTPRYSHSAFCVGGEIVVVGGHTSGFVPTPTAEYFSGGEWHQVETVYPHDNGFAIVMRSLALLFGCGAGDAPPSCRQNRPSSRRPTMRK